MTQLRHAHGTAPAAGIGVDNGRGRLTSPNRLTAGRTCDGCKWPSRCANDDLCWTAEKADIAAERV